MPKSSTSRELCSRWAGFGHTAAGRFIPLALVLTVMVLSACGDGRKVSKRTLAKLSDDRLAEYQEGTITVDEAAKWFTLFGDRSKVRMEDGNETQWVLDAVRSQIVERNLAEEARQLGLDERSDMQRRRRRYTEEGLARLYHFENVVEPIRITDQDIERYYRDHRNDFYEPVRFSFRMIFFDAEKHGRQQARRRALEVMDRIDKGAPFDSLIADYSDIDIATRTKDFGPYRPGEGLLLPIEQAALALKEGEVSDIIEHSKGYHIIKLTKRVEAREPPLKEVREKIHDILFEQRLRAAQEEIEQQNEQTLDIQKNYHILGLPITATNDVVLRVADETMTYGDYLDILKEGDFNSEEEFNAEFQRRFRNMIYLALARREGYEGRPEVSEWVSLHMNRDLTYALLESEVDRKITVSDEEIREEFEKNRGFFYYPQMVYVRQIYLPIPTREGMARHELIREIQETKARAFQVIWEILHGLSFEQAARLYSSDPKADTGGLLGWVPFGQSVRFDRAAFKLNEGEITLEPIAQRRGYQLIKVEKKEPRKLKTLDQAWGQINERLLRAKSEKARDEWVAEEVDQADIKLDARPAQLLGPFLREFWDGKSIYTVYD